LPTPATLHEGAPLLHVFTHFDLLIHPLWWPAGTPPLAAEEPGSLWYNAARPALVGLPRPILQLLENPPP
jgi:adenine-specific DNA glycosylase